MSAHRPTSEVVSGHGSALMAVPDDLELGVVHVSEPLDATADRIVDNATAASPDDPAVGAFSALVQSQRQGDRRSSMRRLRELCGFGDSVVVIGARPGRDPR